MTDTNNKMDALTDIMNKYDPQSELQHQIDVLQAQLNAVRAEHHSGQGGLQVRNSLNYPSIVPVSTDSGPRVQSGTDGARSRSLD